MLYVHLAHTPNPDIDGGYWQGQPEEGEKLQAVASLEEASTVCRAYIERNGLGGGNWIGGTVFGPRRKRVAQISYNGRIWLARPSTPQP